MSVAAVEWDIRDLLHRAGAQVLGRRADCPWCCGRRTISLTEKVYFCHRCGAKGNSFTLARELGLARRMSRAEAQNIRRERERAESVANAFLAQIGEARSSLNALHDQLLHLRDQAHERLRADHDNEIGWETLAYICTELPRLRAELVLLSDGTVEDRLSWLEGTKERRREIADRILRAGGVSTFDDKWAEVGDPTCC